MAVVIYIHGFLSSPQSFKAQVTQRWLKNNRSDMTYCCPALTVYPDQAQAILDALVQTHAGEPIYLLGSSLGGFWATHLVERFASRQPILAVLINPAVAPEGFAAELVGKPLKNYYSEQEYCLTEAHVEHFKRLKVSALKHKPNYWLMAQTADEVLDYRHAVDHYTGCKQTIEPGGSHSFEGFERHLPAIFDFFEQWSLTR